MKKPARFPLALVLLASLVYSAPMYAYLDPGTGSIVLQAVAASLIGIAAFWGRIRMKVQSFFGTKSQGEAGLDGSDEPHRRNDGPV